MPPVGRCGETARLFRYYMLLLTRFALQPTAMTQHYCRLLCCIAVLGPIRYYLFAHHWASYLNEIFAEIIK